jgi:hypothetical protein
LVALEEGATPTGVATDWVLEGRLGREGFGRALGGEGSGARSGWKRGAWRRDRGGGGGGEVIGLESYWFLINDFLVGCKMTRFPDCMMHYYKHSVP